jgi:hypothetical protein
MPIRCGIPLHVYRAIDHDGRACVVVMAPRATREDARAKLGALARAHALAAGDHVPNVLEASLDSDLPWVALDCDAVADLGHVVDFIRLTGEKPPFRFTSVLGKTYMETLARTHRLRDPETRRAVCLGGISTSNTLFSAEGRMSIIGFGVGPLVGAAVAPEVALGDPPTPGADGYALAMFMREHISLAKLPPIFHRVFSGETRLEDAKGVLLLAWSNVRIITAPPAKRPEMEELLEQAGALWRACGITPDLEGWTAFVSRALVADPELAGNAPHARIVIGPDADWIETPNGERHTLGGRRPLRRLLLALAEARRDRSGKPLTIDQLLDVGWPGETPVAEAGQNRVYVAISTLRKLGLGDSLQRWDDGYRLDPDMPTTFASRARH